MVYEKAQNPQTFVTYLLLYTVNTGEIFTLESLISVSRARLFFFQKIFPSPRSY